MTSSPTDLTVDEILSITADRLGLTISDSDGCTADEIQAIASSQGLAELPSDFERYLRLIGHRSSPLQHAILGYDATEYLTGQTGELLDLARQFGEAADPPITFRSQRVLLLDHEGYLVEYIDGTSNDDSVKQIYEDGSVDVLYPNFRSWLAGYAAVTRP